MCLRIKLASMNDSSAPVTLRKDKLVWKILSSYYTSPFQRFKYTRGRTYKMDCMGYERYGNRLQVRTAFHAYLESEIAEKKMCKWLGDKVYKFVIPAGSKVYYGNGDSAGEICSDQIEFPKANSDSR